MGEGGGCGWWTRQKEGETEPQVDVRQVPNMLASPTVPQPVWGNSQILSDYIFTPQFYSTRDKEILSLFLRYLCFDFSRRISQGLNGVVSQWQPLWTMDDEQWFQRMAADSGDEACMAADLYNDCFPVVDTRTPYGRVQTTAAGVSAVNFGRDLGPSQPQQDKEPTGSERMFLPNPSTTNTYTRGLGANYDAHQYSWGSYNTAGSSQTQGYLEYSDGLPGDAWGSNMPVFGEPLGSPQVSTNSFSSSTYSSATSDAMAAMTLDPMVAHDTTAGNLRASTSASSPDNPGSTWTPNYPPTISPKVLRIRPSPTPTPTSSSESFQANLLPSGDSDLGSSSFEPTRGPSPLNPQKLSKKPRKELPSKRPRPRAATIVPSAPSTPKNREPTPPPLPTSPRKPRKKTRVAAQPKKETRDPTPIPDEEPPSPSPSEEREPDIAEEEWATKYRLTTGFVHELNVDIASGERIAKDRVLVRLRNVGFSYKEIREIGKFTEAESTLRGRYRTLTKDKGARVRKPEWQEKDIRLLRTAFNKLNKGDDRRPNVAWGQVADYISSHGGSYKFGGATCHRKWKEVGMR